MFRGVYSAMGQRATEVALPATIIAFLFIFVVEYDALTVIGAIHISMTIWQLGCLISETDTVKYITLPTMIATFTNILLTNTVKQTPIVYYGIFSIVEFAYVIYPSIFSKNY